ncbi:MAG TPA: hypothetical protein VGM86_16530 [Thermoanaerobaculia bacterium]|jgi:hypothetical protein
MKTDRLFATRVTTVLAVGLLLGADLPAAGGVKVQYKFGKDHEVKLDKGVEIGATAVLAKALAKQVQQVHDRLVTNRKALRTLSGPGNAPGYLANEVTGLISETHKDLDQAIQSVQPSSTAPLRAWADDQFQQIQEKIPPPGPTASLPGPSAPHMGVALASLRGGVLPVAAKPKPKKPAPPKPKPAPPKAAPPPKPQTIPTSTADRLLDQVEKVVSQIFTLADHNNLEVDLWVGSTQERKAKLAFWQSPHATFSFWPQGKIKDSQPARSVIRMAGKKDHVPRGLYSYEADLGLEKEAVTQTIKYPDPAAPIQSERLDLVNGTGFFCCRFKESYCHAVADEKDCR